MSMKNEQGSMDVKQKNVLQKPLHKHSAEPTAPKNLPSTLHAGFCTAQNPIAAILTSCFLDFSASQGTDLRKFKVEAGGKYCLDASSWKGMADKGGDVPKVKLESTHVAALEKVDLGVLKKFAAEQERQSLGGASRAGDGDQSFVKESQEIGGKEPRA
ncbi:hypothetical protein EK21DRAFT_80000 [Setomelanomma holmii]|uniref:Uncharacterized protein n=1 Tax=Setomelanomma holmii TaxID=210430 RepID=A0A9P4GY54_9PLEO|nr:hypothetical protein EK21DRAFT_80000 [Setomelanomma holmii]